MLEFLLNETITFRNGNFRIENHSTEGLSYGGSMNSNIVSKLIATGKFDFSKMKNPSQNIVANYGTKTKEFGSPASIPLLIRVLKTYNRKTKVPSKEFTLDKLGSFKLTNDFIKDKHLDYEEIKNKYNALIDTEIRLKKQSLDFVKSGHHRDIPKLEGFKIL